MNKPTLKMPGFFDEAYVILTMPRGKQRRTKHTEIIIETLTALGSQRVTKDELQRLAHIQRKRFLETFKALVAKGSIDRFGTGIKADPFRYSLAVNYGQQKRIVPRIY